MKAQVEELVKQKESFVEQLELQDKKNKDITLFCDRAYKIQEKLHHSQVILTGGIHKMRLMMAIMKVIVVETL